MINMPEVVVFDIETYRPDWKIRRTRREDFNPTRNAIITVGIFDGEKILISPIIESLKEERNSVEFFLKKLQTFENPKLIGYNILNFDIPYLVHKSKSVGKDFNAARFKPLDLYWIFPYWLHNTSSGREFFSKGPRLGNLWKFEYVVKHILEENPNPFSNKEIPQLWEMKRFDDIRKHLELDLTYTFSLLKSSAIQEALNDLERKDFDKSRCKDHCPYQQLLLQTPVTASRYCTLLQEIISDEINISAIDVIIQPLPEWGVSWVPHCLE
ncbi:MAG: 3'-5' exonuclease [Candidatus Hodarchaeales archaeon]